MVDPDIPIAKVTQVIQKALKEEFFLLWHDTPWSFAIMPTVAVRTLMIDGKAYLIKVQEI